MLTARRCGRGLGRRQVGGRGTRERHRVVVAAVVVVAASTIDQCRLRSVRSVPPRWSSNSIDVIVVARLHPWRAKEDRLPTSLPETEFRRPKCEFMMLAGDVTHALLAPSTTPQPQRRPRVQRRRRRPTPRLPFNDDGHLAGTLLVALLVVLIVGATPGPVLADTWTPAWW
ncbi:unnamed protein product [Soboliphyme baturini]|uniref:Uncharacterized protein n=1 Tax=Soboliphyme baturini TaxID=241478 RepID=A0A183JAQ1_9BILA|nr:unnamed protein product [Soboliphyme baturini]